MPSPSEVTQETAGELTSSVAASAAFLSYSRDDSEFVQKLARDLKAAGANVWLDQLDIRPGQPWDETVQQAVDSCGRIIVVLSPSSVSSRNVLDEIATALDAGKVVIPLLYRACTIPLRLRRLQYVDFQHQHDYELGLARIKAALASGGEVEGPPPRRPDHSRPDNSGDPRRSWRTAKVAIGSTAAVVVLAVASWWGWGRIERSPSVNPAGQTTGVTAPGPTGPPPPQGGRQEQPEGTRKDPGPSTPGESRVNSKSDGQQVLASPGKVAPPPKQAPSSSGRAGEGSGSAKHDGRVEADAKTASNGAELQQLQQRLVNTQSEAEPVLAFWADMKSQLAAMHQPLRPEIQAALGALSQSTANANRSLQDGNANAARASLDNADEQLKRLRQYQNP